MIDNYDHPKSNLVYVVENIPGPRENTAEYEAMLNNFNSQITTFCTCKGSCSESCICVWNSGGPNYIACEDKNINLILNYNGKDFNNHHIIECNNLCQCPEDCGNRLVQYGPIKNLMPRPCRQKGKGLGLFTSRTIPRGAFICEYAGELLSKSQALARHNQNTLFKKMNYIFCLNEYSGGNLVQTFVDPSKYGNVGRYINHSCEPNCQVIPVRVDNPIPKLAIFCFKDIKADSEITFDYGAHNCEGSTSECSAASHCSASRKKCCCQSINCRGKIPFNITW